MGKLNNPWYFYEIGTDRIDTYPNAKSWIVITSVPNKYLTAADSKLFSDKSK